jgi:hypothetical protein
MFAFLPFFSLFCTNDTKEVAYFPPLPLYHTGNLICGIFWQGVFAVMCRASCRHGAVWTENSDKSTKLGKRVGTDKKA